MKAWMTQAVLRIEYIRREWRMEEYTFNFQCRALSVVASRKALEKSLVQFGVSSFLRSTVWGPKNPPVLLTATHLIRAKVLR